MGILMLNGNNYTGGIQQVYGSSSGAIASFDDGGNNKPLKSLKVAINPIQASGTPSPSNPLPISGWTECKVQRCKNNLFDYVTYPFRNNSYFNGITITNTDGTVVSNEYYKVTDGFIPCAYLQGLNIYYNKFPSISNYAGICFYSEENENSFISAINKTGIVPNGSRYMKIAVLKAVIPSEIMINLGSSEIEFEPYNGTTYPITWSDAGEVFGGLLDVTSGVIYPFKCYSSYNGETLVGRWLSSMDVYIEGTTPTIGAQVVDFGAYDTDISIPIPNITTLLGNNKIWSDTGEILECVYQRDLNLVINQFDERITALEQAIASLSGTRSLSLSKSAVKEEETEEITEEPKEEEQNEDKR